MFVVKIRKLPSTMMPVFVGRSVVGFLPGSFRPKAECPTKSGIFYLGKVAEWVDARLVYDTVSESGCSRHPFMAMNAWFKSLPLPIFFTVSLHVVLYP